ncbi:hypothetical protein BCR42DRAFT_419717 [Absidia repens]|uniref:Sds3-like-domain-containing protein n=1 Tax=Absidia repens TaxID=90262 RepID=A0A1X2IA66_9FUNG|nr:hypothetical protein BCR42DRAFT_419717 [Absidia repens]
MPIASILETNKPFVFSASSHSNSPSSELTSRSTKASLPGPVHHSSTSHQSTPSSSPLECGPYLYSSLPESDYNKPRYDNSNQQPSNDSKLPSLYQSQQSPPYEGYKYPATNSAHEFNDTLHPSSTSNSTTATLNSRLLSPTPAAATGLSATTSPAPAPPPPSLTSGFSSQKSTAHFKDSAYSFSPTISLTNCGNSSRHQNEFATELTDKAPFHTNSYTALTSFLPTRSTIMETTTEVSPLRATDVTATILGNSTRTTNSDRHPAVGEVDEGESSYVDGSATENRRVKRRKELNQKIGGLNSDFSINKERIFTEKLLVVQNEISQARNNTHTQCQEDLILLESIRQKTIEDGRLFRDYQTQVTDKHYTLEIHHAEEEYLVEKQEIREKLFAVLEEKRRKYKEDKDNCDLAYDLPLETQTRMNKRNLRKRGMDNNGDGKLNKRKQTSVPALVFRLKDDEIYGDLQAMGYGIFTSGKKSSANKKK